MLLQVYTFIDTNCYKDCEVVFLIKWRPFEVDLSPCLLPSCHFRPWITHSDSDTHTNDQLSLGLDQVELGQGSQHRCEQHEEKKNFLLNDWKEMNCPVAYS